MELNRNSASFKIKKTFVIFGEFIGFRPVGALLSISQLLTISLATNQSCRRVQCLRFIRKSRILFETSLPTSSFNRSSPKEL